MSASYNTTQYNTILDAANAIAAPFITTTGGAQNEYAYSLYSATQLQNEYGVVDDVWAAGGPIVGYNSPNGPYNAATDCSGFTARVLSCVRVQGHQSLYANLVMVDGQLVSFKTPTHPQPFPSAMDFANYFTGADTGMNRTNSLWQPIAYQSSSAASGSLSNVQPGDILAYSLPPGNTDTGHVMTVYSIEELTRGQQSQAWPTHLNEFTGSNRFFAVTVYDSSNVLHYQDTRVNGATGVGRGTVLVITDMNGAPVGFQFNENFVLLYVKPIATTLSKTDLLGTLAVGRGIPR